MRLLAFALFLLSADAMAQEATVPADLFHAVRRGASPATVSVGVAPPGLVALFPDGAEVVGSLGWSGPDDADGASAIGRVDAEAEALSTDDGPRAVTLTAVRTAADTYTLRLVLAS